MLEGGVMMMEVMEPVQASTMVMALAMEGNTQAEVNLSSHSSP